MRMGRGRYTHGEVFTVTEQITIKKIRCPYCDSLDTVKHGFVQNEGAPRYQRYQCKDCERHFTET